MERQNPEQRHSTERRLGQRLLHEFLGTNLCSESTSGPKERYQDDLAREQICPDAAQAQAVEHLQTLQRRLLANFARWRRRQGLKRLAGWYPLAIPPERGLYLWGGVGRGKTYLMDMFYDSLPFQQKWRVHFHRFMRRIHEELKALENIKNPLQRVADKLSQNTYVLCFDEFFVSDIGDAMILAQLLEALYQRGVTLVTTSNVEPKHLYRDGLQRAR